MAILFNCYFIEVLFYHQQFFISLKVSFKVKGEFRYFIQVSAQSDIAGGEGAQQ
jgi:hypothetical protein